MESKGKPVMRSLFAVLILMGLSTVAFGGTIAVYVGYADDLRPAPFFPDPWSGSPNTALFSGNATNIDAGAVMFRNTGATPVTINALNVLFNPVAGPINYALWGGSLPFVLQPGKDAIFTQTTQYNFDTSDVPALVPVDVTNNCSVGTLSTTATCVDNAPQVIFDVDGTPTILTDTAHVLNTGGYDFVFSDPCPVAGDTPGACNESLQWRLIGTTGIDVPGGHIGGDGVPEPSSLVLAGPALGLLWWKRKKAA